MCAGFSSNQSCLHLSVIHNFLSCKCLSHIVCNRAVSGLIMERQNERLKFQSEYFCPIFKAVFTAPLSLIQTDAFNASLYWKIKVCSPIFSLGAQCTLLGKEEAALPVQY